MYREESRGKMAHGKLKVWVSKLFIFLKPMHKGTVHVFYSSLFVKLVRSMGLFYLPINLVDAYSKFVRKIYQSDWFDGSGRSYLAKPWESLWLKNPPGFDDLHVHKVGSTLRVNHQNGCVFQGSLKLLMAELWTFWDCIFSRENKVQTFISGFNWLSE